MKQTPGEWTLKELSKPVEPFGSYAIFAKDAPGGIAITVGGLGHEEKANAVLMVNASRMYNALKDVLASQVSSDSRVSSEAMDKSFALISEIDERMK